MLRRALVLGLFAPLLAAAPAHAAQVVVLRCTHGATPAERTVTFEGRIAASGASRTMQMRFTLQAQSPDSPLWAKVSAPGFGTWITVPRGYSRYLYDKTVEDLLAPASYRAIVDFRWRDAAGHVIRTVRHGSRACRQPDPRPNLTAGALSVQPASLAGRRRYVATIVNAGRGDAGPFEVDITREGTLLGSLQLAGLAAGAQRQISLSGPACTPGEQIAVVVDAPNAVDESDEDDNVLSTIC
jgi:CARDB